MDFHGKCTHSCWRAMTFHSHLGSVQVQDKRTLNPSSNPWSALPRHCWAAPLHFAHFKARWYSRQSLPSVVHNTTAPTFCRHVYPNIWQTQQTTKAALLEGQFPQTTRILGLCKVSSRQLLCSGLQTGAKPSQTPHNFTFHKRFVVWAPVSVWDINGTAGTPPTRPWDTLGQALLWL